VKRQLWLACAAIVVLSGSGSVARADNSMGAMSAPHVVMYTPSSIKWVAGTGGMKGMMIATLDGDWSKPGPYTIRLKLPAGTKIPVHYHSGTERATIISGIFMLGIGTKFDESKLTTAPAGSFAVIPAGVRHFAETKVETVVQLSGMGPFDMEMDPKSSTTP
jgi:hypothetical protein